MVFRHIILELATLAGLSLVAALLLILFGQKADLESRYVVIVGLACFILGLRFLRQKALRHEASSTAPTTPSVAISVIAVLIVSALTAFLARLLEAISGEEHPILVTALAACFLLGSSFLVLPRRSSRAE
jgi:hypothetical protein